MKMVGFALFLLFLGFSTGHKTKCYVCHARNAEYCKGKIVECPEGSSCMTVSELLGCNKTFYSIQQRCSMNLNCSADMYAYVDQNVFFHLSYQCCKGDLCNNGTIAVKNETYDYDGLECPYCAVFNSLKKCKPTGTTVCRKSTDKCGHLVGLLRKPDGSKTKFSVQGCMSKEACGYDHSQVVGYSMEKIMDSGCYIPKASEVTTVKPSGE